MSYSRKTEAAIRRYTQDGCERAFYLNYYKGEGASSIALSYNIPNVNTTRQADSAVDAGREIAAAAMADESRANCPD